MLRNDGGRNLAFINPVVPLHGFMGLSVANWHRFAPRFPEISLRPAIIVGWVSR
jgi:hypothetical protein